LYAGVQGWRPVPSPAILLAGALGLDGLRRLPIILGGIWPAPAARAVLPRRDHDRNAAYGQPRVLWPLASSPARSLWLAPSASSTPHGPFSAPLRKLHSARHWRAGRAAARRAGAGPAEQLGAHLMLVKHRTGLAREAFDGCGQCITAVPRSASTERVLVVCYRDRTDRTLLSLGRTAGDFKGIPGT